jgi:hypothetical protein
VVKRRRAAARQRLRAARLPAGQAAVATYLARIYGDARGSLAVESAYRELARAPRRGSSAWRLASEKALERERHLELLLRNHS